MCQAGVQCDMCVLTNDTSGNQAFTTLLYQDCACMPDSTCYSACENDPGCTGQAGTGSQACSDCVYQLPTTDACYPTFDSDCAADADCTRFRQELEGCAALPP